MPISRKKERFARIGMAAAAIFLAVSASVNIFAGRLNYRNYWGGLVFAPYAVAIAAIALLIVVFRWKKTIGPMVDRKGRKIKFENDDWQRW
jgi:hypothetical protein